MSLVRSVLLMSPVAKVTEVQTRNHTWSNEAWGTVEYLDPGGKGYTGAYRTGGSDTHIGIFGYPVGPVTRGNNSICNAPESSPWYPYCSGIALPILAQRGALPHNQDAFVADSFVGEVLWPITWGGQVAFYLYIDRSLPGVYSPGGHFTLLTVGSGDATNFISNSWNSETIVYNAKDSYAIDGYTLAIPLTSGNTVVQLVSQWETISSGIGFYRDTSWMQEGGFLRIGPNSWGETAICQILDITSATGVTVTPIAEIDYHFDPLETNVYYWYSDIKPEYQHWVTAGYESDSSGDLYGGELDTAIQVETKGGMSTTGIVETFIPIPWAIPAPYSIRNTPYTNIWLRLDSPSMPFNLNTLMFKVNGYDVTDSVVPTEIPGGLELFYDPSVDFQMSSRVSVDIDISCSPSVYRYFLNGAIVESQFITLSGGAVSVFQSGGLLHLGPNDSGEEEDNTVAYVSGENEIRLGSPTQYEYVAGDLVIYTYDDYPVELNYYFDIVDDFRPPTFERFDPVDGEQNVDRFRMVMFDIKDEGLGVDISTLSFTVDNMIVIPQIYKFSDNWYRVVYNPIVPYYYNAVVSCFATVMDLSSRRNRSFVTWSFNTLEGQQPIVINSDPNRCAYPVHHKSDVGLDLFAREAGANLHSMLFTWDQKEYEIITYPKIYRES
jgi:hypothetical protein